jgi:hypothetical protein
MEVTVSNTDLSTVKDEHEIANLLIRWGHARDSDDWETLSACFHGDATIHISWISGLAKDFVARSQVISRARRPGTHMKHVISGPWIRVNRDRAFSRCHASLYNRAIMGGHEFDLQSWFRFFDLLEKRDGVWRIARRTAVYDKDRLDPVDPRGVPADFFAGMDLSAFPSPAKFLCYVLVRSKLSPATNIISAYSEEERVLREESEVWLGKG